ncbi:MAG: PaaI family thioesterase [Anaerolineae bacterium]
MNASHPNYKTRVNRLFEQAAFIAAVGIRLNDIGPGRCETVLSIEAKHLQQDTFVHAGVQATMADHTAGAAAKTLMGDDEIVLTVEFKINLLRPARGDCLRCRAAVLKPGRRLIIAESEVYAANGAAETLVAKAMVTLARVPANR